jgi:hypothetical protein
MDVVEKSRHGGRLPDGKRGESMGSFRFAAQRDADDLERQRRSAARGSMLLLERLCDAHGEAGRPDLYVHPLASK